MRSLKVNNVHYALNKANILRIFDTERYKFSYLAGIVFIFFGVFVAKEFNPHPTTILAESIGFGLHGIGMLPFITLLVKSRPKMTHELIKFYRRGYFITNNHTATQCTAEGWKGYRYKVTLEAGKKLDAQGFLIDHNELHKLITDWVEREDMVSCEQTLQRLCYAIGEKAIDYGVDLRRLGLEIAPIDHNLLKENSDGELEPAGHVEPSQIMPAGAEYWCEFPAKR